MSAPLVRYLPVYPKSPTLEAERGGGRRCAARGGRRGRGVQLREGKRGGLEKRLGHR